MAGLNGIPVWRADFNCGGASIGKFAEEQRQRAFSGATGFGRGPIKSIGALDRAISTGAIYFPSPRFGTGRSVHYDDGKIGVIDHGEDILRPH
jgi:hypothetical protein